MNRMSRNAVSAALAVVVAFGVTSPAIAATNAHAGSGHTRAGHAKADHVAKSHKGSAKEVRAAKSKAEKAGHKADKADGHKTKVDHRLANAQRKVTKEAVRKDRQARPGPASRRAVAARREHCRRRAGERRG